MSRIIFVFLFAIIASSCSDERPALKMVKVLDVGGVRIEDQPIVDLLADQKDIEIDLAYTFDQDSVIDLIENNKIDLAVIPNSLDLEYTSNIKTITALLPRVLLIIYDGELGNFTSIKELLIGRRIGYQSPSNHDLELFENVFAYYDIDIREDIIGVPVTKELTDFTDIDVYISLTHLHNSIVENLVDNGGKIFSLDDPRLEGEGSSVDGFLLTTPKAYSFTLPKLTYTFQPEDPVLTIAVKDILIANASLNNEVSYDIIESISENRAALTHRNKNYGLLNPEYNSLNTAFAVPLHKGAVRYLNRYEPSFFERYAKIISIVISSVILVNAVLPHIITAAHRRRRERTDIYYKQLLTIRDSFISGRVQKQNALVKLDEVREIVLQQLAKDKLDADESFQILLNLFAQVKEEIEKA